MVNMTLAIPQELNNMMKEHTEIKWSEIARRALWLHARKLELMEELVSKSELNEDQAEDIGKKIKASLRKRHVK